MTGRLALAAIATLGASAVQADPRITTRPYQAASVVTLHGKEGIESTIAFAEDEHIENVAVGNSAAWQVTPNKRANLLFVKPAGARAHTNMTVITDRHTYLFDLVSAAGAAPVYMLRFTYPDRPKIETAAAAQSPATGTVATAPAVLAAATPAAIPPAAAPAAGDPADLNFAWTSAGDRRLLPARTYDDGHATFLAWPKDAVLPAILTRGPTGQEGPVNFTVRGDTIVVDGVPAQIVLRSGKLMATLTPALAPRPASVAPATMAMTESGSTQP